MTSFGDCRWGDHHRRQRTSPSSSLQPAPDLFSPWGLLQVPNATTSPFKLPRDSKFCGCSLLQGTSQTISQIRITSLPGRRVYWGVSFVAVCRGMNKIMWLLCLREEHALGSYLTFFHIDKLYDLLVNFNKTKGFLGKNFFTKLGIQFPDFILFFFLFFSF